MSVLKIWRVKRRRNKLEEVHTFLANDALFCYTHSASQHLPYFFPNIYFLCVAGTRQDDRRGKVWRQKGRQQKIRWPLEKYFLLTRFKVAVWCGPVCPTGSAWWWWRASNPFLRPTVRDTLHKIKKMHEQHRQQQTLACLIMICSLKMLLI